MAVWQLCLLSRCQWGPLLIPADVLVGWKCNWKVACQLNRGTNGPAQGSLKSKGANSSLFGTSTFAKSSGNCGDNACVGSM